MTEQDHQVSAEMLAEAEQYYMKAMFIFHELQANKQVYGSNSAVTGATPANIPLALQYITRCVELFPENPVYLNLMALLLWEGAGNRQAALPILERAAQLAPRDIDIQNNLTAIRSSSCAVATAAYGSPLATEVHVLRSWRDETLLVSTSGRLFVKVYYQVSPSLARVIARNPSFRGLVRVVLRPLVAFLGRRAGSPSNQQA